MAACQQACGRECRLAHPLGAVGDDDADEGDCRAGQGEIRVALRLEAESWLTTEAGGGRGAHGRT